MYEISQSGPPQHRGLCDSDPYLGMSQGSTDGLSQSSWHYGQPHSEPSPGTGSSNQERPLRVIHVGQHLVRAGIEMWLKALVHHSNPQRLQFQRCIVTGPMCDPSVVRELQVPVEIGGAASVVRAAQDCDIMLMSGPAELGVWLKRQRPALGVFVAHGDGEWTMKIMRQCAPVVDHVVAVSQRVQQAVCQGFPTTVIYNGVDTAHLTRSAPRSEVRKRFGLSDADFVVGSVMRLSTEKRPELLIEALSRLPQHFKLLLVGWGPLQQKLLDLANRIAPLRCVITPGTAHMGDYYSAFDAFCLPSQSEGFGLATLEAMFCGVPVVTTNTGFAPELLVDRSSYVQCEGTAESVACSVQMLADHPHWTAGLKREGQLAAERFGFAKTMCQGYENLLARLWKQRLATAR